MNATDENRNMEQEALNTRAALYNKSMEELHEILHIAPQEFPSDTFSKEQLIEFILTPLK